MLSRYLRRTVNSFTFLIASCDVPMIFKFRFTVTCRRIMEMGLGVFASCCRSIARVYSKANGDGLVTQEEHRRFRASRARPQ